ncbi:MAG: carboxylesterase family protein [Bacteroidota bacterium]|nr:carboxylesterase family protein [Bacteroidota bacterium]
MKFTWSKISIALLSAFIVFSIKVSAQNTDPVVKTDKGFIKGITENGITVFKGVPYAAPPIGSLRFIAPVEHAAWNDTLSAQKFGSIAVQPGGKQVQGTEDCLSMNIYTPKTDDKKRAVVVWVHGGSMTAGSGKGMDGHAFADNDNIVTITINYRLGAFGFLYMDDVDKRYAGSGNCGLLDCVMALKWIKQNIASFGGDPSRVTIMGESAGAKLISAVLVSPQSKGLFQQYIAESGSVQCIRDVVTAKNERLKILQQLGLGPNDAGKLLTLPADSIMKAQTIVCADIGGNSFFGPVYDGIVIKEDGYKYAAGKEFPRIKALIGTNKYEAAAFVSEAAWSKDPENTILKPLFRDGAPLVNKTYQNELKNSTPYDAAVKVVTQYMYQMHSYRFAKALSQNGIPVWMYRFDYDNDEKYGARHGVELHYIWSNPKVKDKKPGQDKLDLEMHSAWVSFIKTGNPNVSALPNWPLYKNDTRQVMIFDGVNKVEGMKEVFDDKSFPSQVFSVRD